MIVHHLIILSIICFIVNASPVNYQNVQFVRNSRSKTASSSRTSRSFAYSTHNNKLFSSSALWDEEFSHPHENSLSFEEHRGHITPDYSNGLEYPDPLLLTGQVARRTASYLYRKPLFFEEINHVELLYNNQEQRRHSGLAGNKLGSLRPYLPFYRFKQQNYRYY